MFLRKEGFDAAVVSEDPATWAGELGSRPFGAAPLADADVVVVSPHVTGQRRNDLCQQLRTTQSLQAVPIVTLRDAGDADAVATHADASIAWPFRLREVLGAIDSLTGRVAPQATA